MKNKVSSLGVLLFAIIAAQNAFADGNYNCNNQDVVSGKRFLGVGYNVVVGIDSETQVRDAKLYSSTPTT